MTRDEMMKRAKGAVGEFGFAIAGFHVGELPAVDTTIARAALLTAIRACLDWTPGCDGCWWDDGLVHTDCMECRRGSAMDHYEPAGGEEDR